MALEAEIGWTPDAGVEPDSDVLNAIDFLTNQDDPNPEDAPPPPSRPTLPSAAWPSAPRPHRGLGLPLHCPQPITARHPNPLIGQYRLPPLPPAQSRPPKKKDPFICPDCRAGFPTEIALADHQSVHALEKSLAGDQDRVNGETSPDEPCGLKLRYEYRRSSEMAPRVSAAPYDPVPPPPHQAYPYSAPSPSTYPYASRPADRHSYQASNGVISPNGLPVPASPYFGAQQPPASRTDSAQQRRRSTPATPGAGDKTRLSCDHCPASFNSKLALQEHQFIHTGEKPFTCDKCHATFNRRSSLSNHRRTHSDVMPFRCLVCQALFRWKNSLKCHLDTHARKHEVSPAIMAAAQAHLHNPDYQPDPGAAAPATRRRNTTSSSSVRCAVPMTSPVSDAQQRVVDWFRQSYNEPQWGATTTAAAVYANTAQQPQPYVNGDYGNAQQNVLPYNQQTPGMPGTSGGPNSHATMPAWSALPPELRSDPTALQNGPAGLRKDSLGLRSDIFELRNNDSPLLLMDSSAVHNTPNEPVGQHMMSLSSPANTSQWTAQSGSMETAVHNPPDFLNGDFDSVMSMTPPNYDPTSGCLAAQQSQANFADPNRPISSAPTWFPPAPFSHASSAAPYFTASTDTLAGGNFFGSLTSTPSMGATIIGSANNVSCSYLAFNSSSSAQQISSGYNSQLPLGNTFSSSAPAPQYCSTAAAPSSSVGAVNLQLEPAAYNSQMPLRHAYNDAMSTTLDCSSALQYSMPDSSSVPSSSSSTQLENGIAAEAFYELEQHAPTLSQENTDGRPTLKNETFGESASENFGGPTPETFRGPTHETFGGPILNGFGGKAPTTYEEPTSGIFGGPTTESAAMGVPADTFGLDDADDDVVFLPRHSDNVFESLGVPATSFGVVSKPERLTELDASPVNVRIIYSGNQEEIVID